MGEKIIYEETRGNVSFEFKKMGQQVVGYANGEEISRDHVEYWREPYKMANLSMAEYFDRIG